VMGTHSLWQRTLLLFHVKSSATLDEAEDPREVMDYAFNQQMEVARRVRRGLVEVSTARRQLEMQAARQRTRVPQLEAQAAQALDAGREDLAARALERKHHALAEIEALEKRVEEVRAEEDAMRTAEGRLATRLDAFRARRTMVSARYAAASAQTQARDALFGLTDELGQLDLAVVRAEEKTDRLQAQASAIEMMVDLASGSPLGTGGDDLDAELRAATVSKAAQAELDALKAQRTTKSTK
jgi:phage shock protein A